MTTVMLPRLLACLCMLFLSCTFSATAAPDRSLFRSTSAVVDLADLSLLRLHEAAALCPWILVAYSDGCGHCRSAAPSLSRVAELTFTTSTDVAHEITVAALNCPANMQACHELGVQGVPSFYFLAPSSLAATEVTLPPIALQSPTATGAQTAAPQMLQRFSIGRGESVDMHFDLARTIWSRMTNTTWDAHSKERCVDMRSFLRNAKQADLSLVSGQATLQAGEAFKEDRDFHPVDVANAFFHTLYHEVALVGLDSPERRYALYRFLRAVQQRLPGLGADVLIHEMADYRKEKGAPANPADFASIAVEDWQRLVLSAGIPFQGSPRDLAWQTCKGSSWRYRGFPCGQWLLYHALTVNTEADTTAMVTAAPVDGAAAAAHADAEILFIIKDYARSFFACETCRHNFMRFEPKREEDPVWQLWKVHNLVNDRLANVVEGADPLVPKRQFPGRELCPLCYRDLDAVTTNPESAVVASQLLRFLRQRYRWVPSSLRASTYTTASVPTAGNPAAGEGGNEMILVYKSPLSMNVFLTMVVVVVVVLFAMQYVLRRAKASRVKKTRPILPLRMQL